jgi:hypothetical protein
MLTVDAISLTTDRLDIASEREALRHGVVVRVVYLAEMHARIMVKKDLTDKDRNDAGADDAAYVREIPDRRDTRAREQLLRRVRAEFAELPCLRLTRAQAQRLFGLRPDICDRVLATLVAEHTIHFDIDQRYRMPDDAPLNTPKERTAD